MYFVKVEILQNETPFEVRMGRLMRFGPTVYSLTENCLSIAKSRMIPITIFFY